MNNKYKIFNINYNEYYLRFFKFFSQINEKYSIEDILPDHELNDFKHHKIELNNNLKKLDTESYCQKIEIYENLFSKIKKAKINGLAYKAISSIESNNTISSNLKQFKPQNGYSQKPEYNNSSNISGRLTIHNGPNILVLPKRCRTIFESRFDNGELLSLDFVNLEPRLCLKLVGKNINGDIYEEINKILEFDIDRSIIKRAIISILYGANYDSLKNISSKKSRIIYETIKEYFNMDYLYEISSSKDSLGIRRNFFGRPIWNLEEKRSNVIINNYIQSSAVDISLLYFSSLLKEIDLEKAIPIFIVHDAIVFDIQKDYINTFNNIIKKGYNDKDLGNFPVSISQFNKKCD